jgi:hypothetical protein
MRAKRLKTWREDACGKTGSEEKDHCTGAAQGIRYNDPKKQVIPTFRLP